MNAQRTGRKTKLALIAFALMLLFSSAYARETFAGETQGAPQPVRFATFNASLNRNNAGQLITDLSTPGNAQAATVAEIIQRTQPEVLLINEFDFDEDWEAARLFPGNYLSISQ